VKVTTVPPLVRPTFGEMSASIDQLEKRGQNNRLAIVALPCLPMRPERIPSSRHWWIRMGGREIIPSRWLTARLT